MKSKQVRLKRVTKSSTVNSRKNANQSIRLMTTRVGWLNLSLLVVLVSGLFMYLVQISASTTKGFEVSKLQSEAKEYQENVRSLEQKVNDLKSVEYISEQAQQLNMVAVDNISFMAPLSNGVALRR